MPKKQKHILLRPLKALSLVEILIAVTIFMVIAAPLVLLSLDTLDRTAVNKHNNSADFYTQEAIEAVDSILNRNFEDFTPGTYGLDNSSGQWELSGSSETIDEFYTRSVTVEEVYRDSNGDIVETGGTVDPDTLKVSSNVDWTWRGVRNYNTEISSYITNWASQQVVESTCAEYDAGTYQSDTEGVSQVGPPTDNCSVHLEQTGGGTFSDYSFDMGVGKQADGIVADGTYAYVATQSNSSGLNVYDYSDLSNITTTDGIDIGKKGTDIDKSGDYVFLSTTDSSESIVSVDVSDVSNLSVADSLSGSTPTSSVTVSGNYAYVGADSSSDGFRLYDISDPTSMSLSDSLDVGGQVRDIAVQGDYAYVGTNLTGGSGGTDLCLGAQGVYLINDILVIIGTDGIDDITIDASGSRWHVDASFDSGASTEEEWYRKSNVDEIYIHTLGDADTIDTDTDEPTTINGGDGNDTIQGGDAVDRIFGGGGADTLYGGDDDDVLVGGDGSDTIDGESGSDTEDQGGANEDCGSGGSTSNGFVVVNVSNKSATYQSTSLNVGAAVNAVKISGSFAYVATETSTDSLVVVDISDPGTPRIYNGPTSGPEVYISDGEVRVSGEDSTDTTIEILGTSFSDSITTKIEIEGTDYTPFGSYTNPSTGDVTTGGPYSYSAGTVAQGDGIILHGKSWSWSPSWGWSSIAEGISSPADSRVLVLEDGDDISSYTDLTDAGTLESYLAPYIDVYSDTVTINEDQALVLFELDSASPDPASSSYQDLAYLITLGTGSSSHETRMIAEENQLDLLENVILASDPVGEIEDIAIYDGMLYGAMNKNSNNLCIYDLSTPGLPSLDSTEDIDGKATAIYADEDYIYLGQNTGNEGVYIIDEPGGTYAYSGTYISDEYDLSTEDVRYNFMEWSATAPSGTSYSIQIRTASSQAGLSSATWVGNDGTNSSSYTTSREIITLDPSRTGQRYFQYRIDMTSDGNSTVDFQELILDYSI